MNASDREPRPRLFFGLEPPPQALKQIVAAAGPWVRSGEKPHVNADFHVTLVFLGPCGADELACVREVAAEIERTKFEITFDYVDYWPRARIRCLGSVAVPPELGGLHVSLQNKLMQCGFEPEKRIYKPHVTLARKARSAERTALDTAISWMVEDFCLYESGAGEAATRYRVIDRWSLG